MDITWKRLENTILVSLSLSFSLCVCVCVLNFVRALVAFYAQLCFITEKSVCGGFMYMCALPLVFVIVRSVYVSG